MGDEIWVSCRDFPNYDVSNYGRVRSNDYSVNRIHWVDGSQYTINYKGRILKLRKEINKKTGRVLRLICTPRKNNSTYSVKVHHLVAMAFLPLPKPGQICCHNDGDPTNNHVSNLRWDSYKNNQTDRRAHGTISGFSKGSNSMCGALKLGEKVSNSILKEKDIIEIRSSSLSRKILASIYGVSISTISAVLSRRNWNHI